MIKNTKKIALSVGNKNLRISYLINKMQFKAYYQVTQQLDRQWPAGG